MFVRRENFRQYIKFYPVVSTIIALNLIVYILTLIPIIGDKIQYVIIKGEKYSKIYENSEDPIYEL